MTAAVDAVEFTGFRLQLTLLNSQVQAALLDETIGRSQHQPLFNICFAETRYGKLHPFYKSEVQLLLIFSNSHLCICR